MAAACRARADDVSLRPMPARTPSLTDHRTRCAWPGDDALMILYHDQEWGVPVHDDRKHYEFLVLDGAQAGLSWRTVLHKREAYRRAFAGFDPAKVARYDGRKVRSLLADQ